MRVKSKIIILLMLSIFIVITLACNLSVNLNISNDSTQEDVRLSNTKIQLMSTSALLYSILNSSEVSSSLMNGYPLDSTYWLGKGEKVSKIEEPFSECVQEFVYRPDAAKVIYQTYKSIRSVPNYQMKLNDVHKLSWMEFLLALPEIKNQLNEEEQQQIDLIVYNTVRAKMYFGFSLKEYICHYYSDTYTPGYWDDVVEGQYHLSHWNQGKIEQLIKKLKS